MEPEPPRTRYLDLVGDPPTAQDAATTGLVTPEVLDALLAAIAADTAPVEAAVPLAEAFFDAYDAYFRQQVGPLPWVRRTLPGRVTAITGATCTVAIAGIADRVTGVLYGLHKPTVGDTYPVRFPVALPPAGVSLAGGPWPYGPPWIKVPGGVAHWLYYEQWEDAFAAGVLWRIPWPLPPDATPADGERVQNLAGLGGWTGYPGLGFNTGFAGYHVGARALLWFNVELAAHARRLLLLDDWGFGDPTVRALAPVEWLASSISDAALGDLATIPLVGTHAPTVPVPSGGDAPATVPYAATVFLDGSTTSGQSWIPAAQYPAQGISQLNPLTSEPFFPPRFAQRTTLLPVWTSEAFVKAPGFETAVDTVLGPARTRVQLFLLYRPLGDLAVWAPWHVNAVTLAAYFPDRGVVEEVAVIEQLVYGSQSHLNSIPENTQIGQLPSGEFVIYTTLALGPPVDQLPGFNASVPFALFRGQGPLDHLIWTPIGAPYYYNAQDGTHQPTEVGRWDAPVTPYLPLAMTADGAQLLAWTAGFDYDRFPDRRVIWSADMGETWTVLPDAWQSTGDHGTPFFRPVGLVPIPEDDPRAAPQGGAA